MRLVSGCGEERARIGSRPANTSIRNRRRNIRKNSDSSIRVRNDNVHGRTGELVLKWQDRRGRSRPVRWLELFFS